MAGQSMLKFVTVGRDMPEKRGAETRRNDFREIYAEEEKTPKRQRERAEREAARPPDEGRGESQ